VVVSLLSEHDQSVALQLVLTDRTHRLHYQDNIQDLYTSERVTLVLVDDWFGTAQRYNAEVLL
jgi:hypothetical protein